MAPFLIGLLVTAFTVLAVLVLLATLVCLLLVAMVAVLILLERTGTDVPAAAAALRRPRMTGPGQSDDDRYREPADRGASAAANPTRTQPRAPWSSRTPVTRPGSTAAPAPASSAPAGPPADAPAPAEDEPPAPVRTAARAARRPRKAQEPIVTDDRDGAMDRLFAPLSETDRTQPIAAAEDGSPRG